MEKLSTIGNIKDTCRHIRGLVDTHGAKVVLKAVDMVADKDSKKEPAIIRVQNSLGKVRIAKLKLERLQCKKR